jgi:Subtilase family
VFEDITQLLNIRTKPHAITFPEREIVLVMSNVEAMARLITNSDAVAELRIAKDILSIFLEMGTREQVDWAEDLAGRLIEPGEHAVAISLLDSGVTRIHPLLELGIAKDDLYTVEPAWGKNDSPHWQGHGTAMAGIALYADLLDSLAIHEPVKLLHRLESVKILPTNGQNDPELYGAITEQVVFLPEIQAPNRRRVFCMAVTSSVGSSDRGMPSSWSAAMHKLCFNDNEFPRLMIISVGNIHQEILPSNYPNINDLGTVENPAQAWNPLIVGAYTEKVNVLDPNYCGWKPLAPGGDLSPRSRTSVSWEAQWPIRPDVVFEGGNMAHDGQNPAEAIDDFAFLSLFCHSPRDKITTQLELQPK